MRIHRGSTRTPTLATRVLLSLFVCSAMAVAAATALNSADDAQRPQSVGPLSDAAHILHSSAIRMAARPTVKDKHARHLSVSDCGADACAHPTATQDSSAGRSTSTLKFAGDTNPAAIRPSATFTLRQRSLAASSGEIEASSTGDAALEAHSSSSSSAGEESAAVDSATGADTNSTKPVSTDGATGPVLPSSAEGGDSRSSSSSRGHTLLEWVVIPCALVALTVVVIVALVTTRRCRDKRRLLKEKDDAIAAGVGMVVAAHGKFPYVNPLSPPTIIVETCPLPPIQVLPRPSVWGRGSIGGGGLGSGAFTSDAFGDVRTRVPNNTICAYDSLSWEELRGATSGQWATRHSIHGDGRTASVAETIDVTVADQMII